MQNLVFRFIDNFVSRTSARDMHMALKIHYIYDSITKLRRKQAEVIQNSLNPNVLATGQEKAMHRKHDRFKLGDGQTYDCSGEYLPFRSGRVF
jgi:hypothetical protein